MTCVEGFFVAFNLETVDFAIRNSKVLSLTTYSYFVRERRYIDRILAMYLREIGMDQLQNKLAYCIHELAGNAHKANTKRIYFRNRGLAISDPSDYEEGMKGFKESVIANMDQYYRALKEEGLFLKFYFKRRDSVLKLAIRNNVPLTREEEQKINNKFTIARRSTDLVSTYPELEDFTEGAGLGIVMISQMLKNMGFLHHRFRIYSYKGQTISALELNLKEAAAAVEEPVAEYSYA